MAHGPETGEAPLWRRVASFLLALGVLSGVFTFAFASMGHKWNWAGVWKYRVIFARGWAVTVGLSAVSLVMSCVIGVVIAMLRRTRFLPLRYAARIYVEVIRGTPLLVQILIFFYVVAHSFHIEDR